MEQLNDIDRVVITHAQKAISKNYDGKNFLHTVGAAVLAKSGKIYHGVNVYSIHGACAEQIALGAAITAGEKEFVCIVAVEGQDGENILPPCGNCRQILADYAPECFVILNVNNQVVKVKAKDLLPFAYKTSY